MPAKESFDAALFDRARVSIAEADELFACRWTEDGLLESGLVKGNPKFRTHPRPGMPDGLGGKNPGLTFCASVAKVFEGDLCTRWAAFWTWQPRHDVDLDIDQHVAAHDWRCLRPGLYVGTLKTVPGS